MNGPVEQELGRFRSGISYCEHEINLINEKLLQMKQENEELKEEVRNLKSNFLLNKPNDNKGKKKKK